MRKATFCIVLTALVISSSLATAQEAANTYIIKGTPSDLAATVEAAGGSLLRVHSQIGYATAISDDPDFAANLNGASGVAAVEQDLMVQWTPEVDALAVDAGTGQGGAYDPTSAFFYPCQWNLQQIDAEGAWNEGVFGDGIKVAVLDTGIDPTHQDLAGKVDIANSTSMLSPGSSLCNSILGLPDEETFQDFRFHGTWVASTITGNGLGMAAVAPGVEIVAVKVLSCTGSCSFADVIAGILYAADLPDVDIINMSLGAYFPKSSLGGGQLLGAMTKAVNYANSQGKLVVTASGNDGANLDKDKNFVSLPAQAGTSMSVYATNYFEDVAGYSNFGRSGTWVGAPGGDGPDPNPPLPGCVINPASQGFVLGACPTTSIFYGCGPNSYLIGTGTSFAAPLAAGVAALMDGNYGGSLNPGQLQTGIKKTADDLGKKGSDALYSHGRVNASNAAQH